MNRIFIDGNLTAEPETSTTQSGKTVIKFSIANNDERRKQNDGSYQSIASFFRCEYWPANPQFWLNILKKGKLVGIEGRLKQDQWEQDGQKRSAVKVIVDRFNLQTIAGQKKEDAPVSEPDDEEDVPF